MSGRISLRRVGRFAAVVAAAAIVAAAMVAATTVNTSRHEANAMPQKDGVWMAAIDT